MESNLITGVWQSPVGEILLGSFGKTLCLCDWVGTSRIDKHLARIERHLGARTIEGCSAVIDEAVRQLTEYFAGERRQFDMALTLAGSDFQRSVWHVLMQIPYGAAISYGEEAVRLGRPSAVRAVANANAANAISIFIPCHRVIGSGNTIGGYSGGLDVKRHLLEVERAPSTRQGTLCFEED